LAAGEAVVAARSVAGADAVWPFAVSPPVVCQPDEEYTPGIAIPPHVIVHNVKAGYMAPARAIVDRKPVVVGESTDAVDSLCRRLIVVIVGCFLFNGRTCLSR
jgi:hypothetical protein